MKITLTNNTKLTELIRRISTSDDDVVKVVVEEGSIYARHEGNVKALQKTVQRLGKSVQIVGAETDSQFETNPGVIVSETENQTSEESVVDKSTEGEVDENLSDLDKMNEGENLAGPVPAEDNFPTEEKKPRKNPFRGVSPKALLITFGVLVVIGLVAGAGYVYYYLPRGAVTLFVGERVLERNMTVSVDPMVESASLQDQVIPGQEVTIEVEDTKSFDSTGTKTVGDKAVGTVEVRNFGTSDIQLPLGMILTWPNSGGENLQFSLLETVVVPKATETSPDANTRVMEASVVEVQAQAVDIGEQYNLPADTTFWVEGYTAVNARTDFFAVSVVPFAGGSTEEVKVVTSEDQSVAQEQMKEQLFASASDSLKKELSTGYSFEEEAINNSTKYVQFSNDVGDEADSFTATLKVESSVMTYKTADVKDLLEDDVKINIPDGFELSEENVVVKVEETNVVDDELQLKTKISALVVPVLDQTKIRDFLLGKPPVEAEEYLRSIDEIEGYDVRLWPALPDQIRRFPFIPDRLDVVVEVREGGE